MTELWRGESEKVLNLCIHYGTPSEQYSKPFPRGLCPACSTTALRREMHEENETIFAKMGINWICKSCTSKAKLASHEHR